jgi:hypothetical protein
VIMAMKKAFGLPLPGDGAGMQGARVPVPALRERMAQALEDCDDVVSQRLALKVHTARTPQDLWMLRSDIYSCVAQKHSQTEAARRVNSLLPSFEGWLPSRQLVRI